MTNFICVEDNLNDKTVINLEKIAWVHIPSCTVCMDAISAMNDGLVKLSDNGLKELLGAMYIRGLNDE